MAEYRIRYTQDAIDDLDVIFDYISLDNADAAIKMLDNIDKSISQLACQPRIGAALPVNDFSIVRQGYRYLVVAPYLVFYRFEDDEVRIGRILHSRQNWLFLIFGQKNR